MEDFEKKLAFSIINIDKPTGPTSFSITNFVRRVLNQKKTSHMGTLDPKVTGVLPITLGRACRLAGYLIRHDKTYVGILHTHKEQDIKELQKLIDKNFVGKITQTPPHKSAVKREPRQREVYYFNLTESSEDKRDFVFETKVEGGTYIRKICSDLGEMIGGAHMDELRRTEAGLFDENKMYTLDELEKAVTEYKNDNNKLLKAMLIPASEAIKRLFQCVQVDKRVLRPLLTGKPLFHNDILDFEKIKDLPLGEQFAVFCGEQFVEIARKISNHELIGKPEFVYN